jgi:trk system potassium uptake protein TrkA
MVIGAGRLGKSIACDLNRRNENVLILDTDKTTFDDFDDYSGFISVGDGLDLDTLEENGIRGCHTVVIVTDTDNKNIMIADICRYIYQVPNIFIRLKDSRKEKLLDGEDVHCICQFNLIIDDFNRQIGGSRK